MFSQACVKNFVHGGGVSASGFGGGMSASESRGVSASGSGGFQITLDPQPITV